MTYKNFAILALATCLLGFLSVANAQEGLAPGAIPPDQEPATGTSGGSVGTVDQIRPVVNPQVTDVVIDIEPIEEMVFKGNKRACATKSKFYTIALNFYASGKAVGESGETKIIQELLGDVNTQIRQNGVQNTKLSVMQDFAQCFSQAPADKNAEREARMMKEYGGCADLDGLLVNVLKDVKRRTNVDMALTKYRNVDVNLENSTFKKVEDPVPFFVEKLYDAADESFEKAVDTAFVYSTACKM